MPEVLTLTARSYSQISTYAKCPQQHNLRSIQKVDAGPKSPQASRGTDVHDTVENLMLRKVDEVHPEISSYQKWLLELREEKQVPEAQFCFNDQWEAVHWQHADGYIRGYIDLIVEDDDGLVVYEWKTGNIYDDHDLQRNLYGLAALLMYPQYEEVEVISVYFDKKKTIPRIYKRAMLTTYKWMWNERVNKINNDEYRVPNPGYYCDWCPYAKKKGGPCQFGG